MCYLWILLIGVVVCWFLIFCVASFLEGFKHSAYTDTPWGWLVLGAIGWPASLPLSLLIVLILGIHVLLVRLGKKCAS